MIFPCRALSHQSLIFRLSLPTKIVSPQARRMLEVPFKELLLKLLVRLLYTAWRTCRWFSLAVFLLKTLHFHFLSQCVFVAPTVLTPIVSFVPGWDTMFFGHVFTECGGLDILIYRIPLNRSDWLLVHLGIRFNLLLLLLCHFTAKKQQLRSLITIFEKTLFVNSERAFRVGDRCDIASQAVYSVRAIEHIHFINFI